MGAAVWERFASWITSTENRLYSNNIISGAVVPSSNAIGMHFYPIWEAASVDEWLYNGGPYQLIVMHFLLELHHTWDVNGNSVIVLACVLGFLLPSLLPLQPQPLSSSPTPLDKDH